MKYIIIILLVSRYRAKRLSATERSEASDDTDRASAADAWFARNLDSASRTQCVALQISAVIAPRCLRYKHDCLCMEKSASRNLHRSTTTRFNAVPLPKLKRRHQSDQHPHPSEIGDRSDRNRNAIREFSHCGLPLGRPLSKLVGVAQGHDLVQNLPKLAVVVVPSL